MKVTNHYQNIVQREIEAAKLEETTSRKEETTELPALREIIKSSNPTPTPLESNLLGQMFQAALQNSLNESPNWQTMLMSALDALGQQDAVNGSLLNLNTEMALKANQLHQQVNSSDAAKTSLIDTAKKLAEEMKTPPQSGKPEGFKDILVLGAESVKQKKELQEKAIALLEQAKNPEEAKQIAEQFGGPDFKHQIVDNQLKDRLTQVAQKNNMPGLGHTLSAEQLSKNAEKIEKADGDKTVELAKDTELLRNATPEQKIKMVKELGKGFDGHDDKKCIAIDRILSSCKTKAEFDQVLDGAGGKELVQHLNGDEAKQRVNELCGMWGRMDAATMPEVAKKFEGLMTDPAKQAEYSGVRPPSSEEVKTVGSNLKSNPPDPAVDQATEKVKENMANKAYSADWDQGSKVELIREQRRRELKGEPKLDYTTLVARAEQITNASDDEIRAYKKKKPDEKISEDDKKDYIKEKMEAFRKETGLSEQSINDLVTRKMGNIYAQGAGEMAARGQQTIEELKMQLNEVVKTKGENSPEAQQLKARIETLSKSFENSTTQLGKTSQTYHDLFPMPPSFSEMIGKIFGAIGDVAASIFKMVPGWGQAFSGIYTAAKSIGQGDILGGFAGFAGQIAGPGYKEVANFVQRASRGDFLDAVGNYSKEVGGAIGDEAIKMGKNIAREDWNAVAGQLSQGAAMLVGAGGAYRIVGEVAQKGIDTARATAKIVDAANKGDALGVLGGMAEAAGAYANVKGVGEYAKYASIALNTAKGVGTTVDGFIKGNFDRVINGLSETASGMRTLGGSKSPLAGPLDFAQNGLAMLSKFSHGDIAGGLMMGIGLTSPYVKNDAARTMLDSLQRDLPSVQSLIQGNLGAVGRVANMFGNFSTDIHKFVNNPDIQKFLVGVGNNGALLQQIQKGDVMGIVNSLTQKGGMLQTLGDAGFAEVINKVGSSANELLNSPAMRQVKHFTEIGTSVMQNLASGKTDEAIKILSSTAGEYIHPQLRSQLESIIPMAKSMASGEFDKALKQFAENPQMRALANQLSILRPFSDLAQGTALSNFQNLSNFLEKIVGGASQANAGAMGLGMNLMNQMAQLPGFQNLQQIASLDGPLGIPVNAMAQTISALGSGDAQKLTEVLTGSIGQPSLLQALSSGALSQGIVNLSNEAAQMISSSEFNNVKAQLEQIAALSQRQNEIQFLEHEAKSLAGQSLSQAPDIARRLLEQWS